MSSSSSRFDELRAKREEALAKSRRELMHSIEEIEEVTEDVKELKQSVKVTNGFTRAAAIITALGGAAGLTQIVRMIISTITEHWHKK